MSACIFTMSELAMRKVSTQELEESLSKWEETIKTFYEKKELHSNKFECDLAYGCEINTTRAYKELYLRYREIVKK